MTELLIHNNQLSARNEPFCIPAEAGIYPRPISLPSQAKCWLRGLFWIQDCVPHTSLPGGRPTSECKARSLYIHPVLGLRFCTTLRHCRLYHPNSSLLLCH